MRRGAAALVRIAMQEATARATADEVARRSFGRLVAILAARGNDIAAAEDALAEASRRPSSHGPATASRAIPKHGC